MHDYFLEKWECPSSFNEVSITFIPESDREITEKKTSDQYPSWTWTQMFLTKC